jgi:8-oxo-dGTP diphosphatase
MSKRFTAPVAVHLFLLRGGEVLLLRRANTGYEDGNYSVIAGHLDGGELAVQAMIREAREEAGIAIRPEALTPVGVMHRRSTTDERIDFFFACEQWEGEIVNAEPHKCDELAFYDLDRLPPNVIPYVRRALENYRSGRWFDEYGWE